MAAKVFRATTVGADAPHRRASAASGWRRRLLVPVGRRMLVAALCALPILCGSFTPAAAATVEVDAPRLLLADVLPGIGAPWANVDVGAAPAPLAEARLTAQAIAAYLRAAGLSLPPQPLPRVLRVVRAGRRLLPQELARLVRQELVSSLPAGSFVGELRIGRGVVVPKGPVQVALQVPYDLPPGPHTLQVEVTVGGRAVPAASTTVSFELSGRGRVRSVPVLERGSPVTVQVRCGNVLLQSQGAAQEPGSIGDSVAVLPQQGERVLRGRVIDAQTVEVQL